MGNTNKILKDYYRQRLLEEFNFLKLEDSMQEVLEYVKFIKEQEKELIKLYYQEKHHSNKNSLWITPKNYRDFEQELS